ncbi:hypothetical protein GCM10023260_05860 [Bartonella acomydis]|uniref:Uncharacterized protein n=1 Tax=Bartonella acomydis TaxID=686234 RepID=A0ABP9ML88_9HYPH
MDCLYITKGRYVDKKIKESKNLHAAFLSRNARKCEVKWHSYSLCKRREVPLERQHQKELEEAIN